MQPKLRKITSFQGTESSKQTADWNKCGLLIQNKFYYERRWGKADLPFQQHNTENSQTFSHEFPFMCHHLPWFSQDIAINDGVGARRCFHWHRHPDVFQLLALPISPRLPFSLPQRLHHSSPLQSGSELIWLSEIKKMLINILNKFVFTSLLSS